MLWRHRVVIRRSQGSFRACGNLNRGWIFVPQSTLNRRPLGLEPWRQAKHFRRFLIRNVFGEAWTIGRDREIHAAWPPKIDSLKILAIERGRDVKAVICEHLGDPVQGLAIGYTQGNVVCDARADVTRPVGRSAEKIDRAGPRVHQGSETPRLPDRTPQNPVFPSEISTCAENLRFESRRIESAELLDRLALSRLDHSSLFRWLPR